MSTTPRMTAGRVRESFPPRPARPTWQPATPRRPGWETESTIWGGPPVRLIPTTRSGSKLRRKLNSRRIQEAGQVT